MTAMILLNGKLPIPQFPVINVLFCDILAFFLESQLKGYCVVTLSSKLVDVVQWVTFSGWHQCIESLEFPLCFDTAMSNGM